ncbi:hypothetical protein SAMN04487999_2415 [Leeuwenhoekiella palythoae]|uniref:Uncharacterized protein n=1 Tax=Leeuwenhoekiella palythoae TaxID=573501 RepID=A0A1M5YVP3_9FLAO|nr:hypothetical protein DSM01_1691 [Leeuwenhoekiella palythoae]SHI16162.1 hypothetical protein SAMN04487999_2415 [Leeuwenhoekiella palythoae]
MLLRVLITLQNTTNESFLNQVNQFEDVLPLYLQIKKPDHFRDQAYFQDN